MKVNKLILYLILFITVVGCKPESIEDARSLSLEKDFSVIKKKGYSIMLPKTMEETFSLNPEASLQYANALKNEFIIVINESKENFKRKYSVVSTEKTKKRTIENYANTQLSYTKENMNVISFTKPKKYKIGNIRGIKATKEIKLDNVKEAVSYFFYYLESKTQLFTIMGWTTQQNKAIYAIKLEKALKTFNAK